MTKTSQQENETQSMLISLLGLVPVVLVTIIVFVLISRVDPGKPTLSNHNGEIFLGSIWGGLALLFLYVGISGLIRGEWGNTLYQVRTTLTGSGAFVASSGSTIGGMLLVVASVMSFYPNLGPVTYQFAAIVCWLVSTILSWLIGFIIKALE
jgi:hypothetical protein